MLGSALPLAQGDLPTAREVWSKGRREGVQRWDLLLISAATGLSARGDVL